MSFALTTEQVRARTKTVTRRIGWTFLKRGDEVQAVVKCQGLKKGERVKPLAHLYILDVRREPLNAITSPDVVAEGFPHMPPSLFIEMFCDTHKGCTPTTIVTRIAFMYDDAPPAKLARQAPAR